MPQLTLELETTTHDNRPVFICGNFNNWNAADPAYQLQQLEPGKFQFVFPEHVLNGGKIEYKFTRGDWHNMEVNRFGLEIDNRILIQREGLVQDRVPRWKVNGLAYNIQHLPKIETLDNPFEFPDEIKTRRIAVLLPHNYYQTDKHYPVLYLQDGQNLFDEHAPFGNWGVNKRLAVLTELGMGDVIVVAIDHAHEQRIAEYSPAGINRFGKGLGKQYLGLLAEKLKPYVDERYRTMRDREHTGLGGSSMGELISIYGAFLYPEVYSRFMIFSPSLWVAPNIHFEHMNFFKSYSNKIYLYGGGQEGSNMIPNIKRLKGALERKGVDGSQIEFNLSIDPNGQHNEHKWGREFPAALEWLFF